MAAFRWFGSVNRLFEKLQLFFALLVVPRRGADLFGSLGQFGCLSVLSVFSAFCASCCCCFCFAATGQWGSRTFWFSSLYHFASVFLVWAASVFLVPCVVFLWVVRLEFVGTCSVVVVVS